MNRPPRQSRTDHRIPETSKRLNLYAMAASAAGVSLLAMTQPMEAEIIFTPSHLVIGAGGIHRYDLDVDGDGVTDFAIQAAHRCNTDQCFYNLFDRMPPGNGIVARARGGGWSPEAEVLKRGTPIGSSRRFFAKNVSMASFYFGGGGSSANGNWANVSNRFLGLSFKINGETHYGWARLSVKDANLEITAVITGYAYETEPNKPINAGDQGRGSDAGNTTGHPQGASVETAPTQKVPTLGLLSLGALGLNEWR